MEKHFFEKLQAKNRFLIGCICRPSLAEEIFKNTCLEEDLCEFVRVNFQKFTTNAIGSWEREGEREGESPVGVWLCHCDTPPHPPLSPSLPPSTHRTHVSRHGFCKKKTCGNNGEEWCVMKTAELTVGVYDGHMKATASNQPLPHLFADTAESRGMRKARPSSRTQNTTTAATGTGTASTLRGKHPLMEK